MRCSSRRDGVTVKRGHEIGASYSASAASAPITAGRTFDHGALQCWRPGTAMFSAKNRASAMREAGVGVEPQSGERLLCQQTTADRDREQAQIESLRPAPRSRLCRGAPIHPAWVARVRLPSASSSRRGRSSRAPDHWSRSPLLDDAARPRRDRLSTGPSPPP